MIAPDTIAVPMPEQLTLQGAAQALEQLSQSLVQQPGPTVVLNAEPLKVFDTSAVAVLLELRNVLQKQGKTLQVSRMPQRLQALVTLYGVAELLPA